MLQCQRSQLNCFTVALPQKYKIYLPFWRLNKSASDLETITRSVFILGNPTTTQTKRRATNAQRATQSNGRQKQKSLRRIESEKTSVAHSVFFFCIISWWCARYLLIIVLGTQIHGSEREQVFVYCVFIHINCAARQQYNDIVEYACENT